MDIDDFSGNCGPSIRGQSESHFIMCPIARILGFFNKRLVTWKPSSRKLIVSKCPPALGLVEAQSNRMCLMNLTMTNRLHNAFDGCRWGPRPQLTMIDRSSMRRLVASSLLPRFQKRKASQGRAVPIFFSNGGLRPAMSPPLTSLPPTSSLFSNVSTFVPSQSATINPKT